MKIFFKSTLLAAFSFSFFYVSAQINSSDPARGNLFDMIERLVDSLGKTQGLKNVEAKISDIKTDDLKEIDLNQSFHKIEIFGDVKIILTNGPKEKLWLKGERPDLEHTKVNIKNERLVINCGYKTKSKLQVYVSALDVASLVIDGDSEIFSSGTIDAKALEIILNGTSMVSVRYKGKLDVFSGDKTELISVEDYRKIVSRK